MVNRILKDTPISTQHKQAILAAKSWGMNTSYGIGEAFANALEAGKTGPRRALRRWRSSRRSTVTRWRPRPTCGRRGTVLVRPPEYMKRYRAGIEGAVKAALDEGIHYANIVTVPAYCVGDIAHHISQSTFNMCKDNVVIAAIEAATAVMERTLKASLEKFTDVYQPLALATGASAAAAEYILGSRRVQRPHGRGPAHPAVPQLRPVKPEPERGSGAPQLRLHGHGLPGMEAPRQGASDEERGGGPIVPKVAGFPSTSPRSTRTRC